MGLSDMAFEHGELFFSLIVFNKYKTIVEIGVAFADATQYLCSAAQKTDGFVYGYDIWDTHGIYNQFGTFSSKEECENKLRSLGYENFELNKINTKTIEFKNLINTKHKNLDFVFIDGCHSYEGIKNDFFAVFEKLSVGGMICFHDTLRIDGCREFMIDLRTIYNDGTFDIIDFPQGNLDRRCGVSILVKRSYPIIDIPIDEICGSPSNPEDIYIKEKDWFYKQLNQN